MVAPAGAWWALKCPVSASISCGVLIRILPLASSRQHRGSRSPAISAVSIARAETPDGSLTTDGQLDQRVRAPRGADVRVEVRDRHR